MRHVASFSTGLSSALMVERLLARYGDAVTIVCMDTTIEDADNWRFADDMRARWGREIVMLREGRDPYQVAADQHIIPNQKIAPCTYALKIEMFVRYLETLTGPLTIHVGYDFSEIHRCAATTRNYAEQGWAVDFPLLWKPYEFRYYAQVAREDWGVEPPRMYGMGYTHANCGGRCVKQGAGDWLRTLIHFPERYRASEEWEATMRENETNADYALLRDQTGGQLRPKTLRQLREEHERGLSLPLFALDQASGCVVCGVGDALPAPVAEGAA